MTRRLALLFVFTLFMTGVRPAVAHETYRIVGAITEVSQYEVTVKQTKDGKVIKIEMDRATKVTRAGKAVDRATLKAGVKVTVIAEGDSLKELFALEVRVVGSK